MREAGPGRILGVGVTVAGLFIMSESDGRIGEIGLVLFGLGDSFGVSGGEIGNPAADKAPSSLSTFLGEGEGLLVLLPGGGRIRLSSSSTEKLFSRYSLPWDLYM